MGRMTPRVCIFSTADSSGNGRTAYAVGVKPDVVTSPLAGLSFDGIDRDNQSSSMSAGVTGFGVTTADGSMQVKATIRRSRTGTIETIIGKWDDTVAASDNYVLWIDSANKLNFSVTNSVPAYIAAVGTTSLASGTTYAVEGNWTGSVLNVKVNGVQEGTTPALTALQAPDSTTPLLLGAFTYGGAGPFPFQGTIASASMTRGGVVQGSWAMTTASCP